MRVTFGSPTGPLAGTGTTDSAGVLASVAAVVPVGTQAGATRVYATDTRSRYPVSSAFTVTP